MDQSLEGRLITDLLAGQEKIVDALVKRLNIANKGNNPARSLRRLDRIFLVAAAGTGLANGIGVASSKTVGRLSKYAHRISTMGFASAAALYVVARARLLGISSAAPEVAEALRTALLVGATFPAADVALGSLGRLARPSIGVPTDPRSLFVVAAGAAVGGWTGRTLGEGVIDAVAATMAADPRSHAV